MALVDVRGAAARAASGTEGSRFQGLPGRLTVAPATLEAGSALPRPESVSSAALSQLQLQLQLWGFCRQRGSEEGRRNTGDTVDNTAHSLSSWMQPAWLQERVRVTLVTLTAALGE